MRSYLNWPEARPVATPKKEKTTLTGKGFLKGSRNETAEDKKSGNKVVVRKSTKRTCFDDFDALRGKEENKPVLLYFFTKDKTDDSGKASKQFQNCRKIEAVLCKPEVTEALRSGGFECYKVDTARLSRTLRKRYRVSRAPTLVFIGATGKVLKVVGTSRVKAKVLARLITTVAKKSEKDLRKLEKKREKEK
ncbi:MAG: hypothetical protein E3J72_10090 [Planctomycetota bacterium]|nr:MAG: hypothetical protein E3J72_10090 [Planctomycetota bacterium]